MTIIVIVGMVIMLAVILMLYRKVRHTERRLAQLEGEHPEPEPESEKPFTAGPGDLLWEESASWVEGSRRNAGWVS